MPLLSNEAFNATDQTQVAHSKGGDVSDQSADEDRERIPKKKKPTPVSSGQSAEATGQPCQSQ